MNKRYYVYLFVMIILSFLAVSVDRYATLIFGSTMMILFELSLK